MDVLHWLDHQHELSAGISQGIIPLVLIPLTTVTVAITSVAGIIAGWFGVKLHTEGPRQFLEVLLKRRILLTMILMNLLAVVAYKTYHYVKTLPSFMVTINGRSSSEALASFEIYTDALFRPHSFSGSITPRKNLSLTIEKEIKLKKGAFRSGLISGNSLFYGVDDGNIYEFDKNNLSIKRKFFVGTQVTTRPIIFKQRIYTGEGNHDTHHARIYSFDLTTGKFLKAFSTSGHTEGQPTIAHFKDRDLLFLTAGTDGLYAIDPLSMTEVWHKKDGHLDATVSIENGSVFIGTGVEKESSRDRSFAVAYEFSSGKTIWKKELPLSNWMHPVITKEDVCYVLGEIYFKSSVGLFYCLNKRNGTPHFAIPVDAPIASKPFYIKDKLKEYVYFSDFKGKVYGIDVEAKEVLWSYDTGKVSTTYSLASVDYDQSDGLLWYPSYDNGLFAIDPKTGNKILHWKPAKSERPWLDNYAAVSIQGKNMYHMDIEGTLRKFHID